MKQTTEWCCLLPMHRSKNMTEFFSRHPTQMLWSLRQLWLERFTPMNCGCHLAKDNLDMDDTYQSIPLPRGWVMPPKDCSLCMPFLVVTLPLASAALARKLHGMSGEQCHISHLCSASSLNRFQRFCRRLCWAGEICCSPHVNEARRHLFAFCNRKICNIPPTKAALFQHVKLAVYQAGHVWGQALTASPVLPSLSEWGWKEDGNGDWIPLWTTQPDASAVCRELIKCSCRVGCSGRCSCYKAALKCTELCAWAGQCN